MTYPNDSVGDVQAWGLTRPQAVRYHARLARMYADKSQEYAARATRYGAVAIWLSIVALVLIGLTAAIRMIEAVA